MFEDDSIDTFEFSNTVGRMKLFGASKPHDETEDTEASSSISQPDDIFKKTNRKNDIVDRKNDLKLSNRANQPENLVKDTKMSPDVYADHLLNKCNFTNQHVHQKTSSSRRRQMHEIGDHKRKHTTENANEQRSSTYENLLESDNPAVGKRQFIDRVKDYMNYGNIPPNALCVTTKTNLVQELKKGLLINDAQETETGKEYLKESTCVYSESETIELLGDRTFAMRDFEVKNGNHYFSYGKLNSKREKGTADFQEIPISEEASINRPLDHYKVYKNPDIRTLADSLSYFRLFHHLQELEMSLEDLRRNKKKKEDHEECFKRNDKEIQKLSFKYHPDKVKNRGGSEKEIARAQELQTALNSTRTALKLLNSAFMEDTGTDHKFGFYTHLSIDSLCNEDEMKYRINEVIFKVGVISRIKQQNIISEIRKFLIESKKCVSSYLGNTNEFEKHRDMAFFHLKCCIKGFKKLCAELDDVKEQCKLEKKWRKYAFFNRKDGVWQPKRFTAFEIIKSNCKSSTEWKVPIL